MQQHTRAVRYPHAAAAAPHRIYHKQISPFYPPPHTHYTLILTDEMEYKFVCVCVEYAYMSFYVKYII